MSLHSEREGNGNKHNVPGLGLSGETIPVSSNSHVAGHSAEDRAIQQSVSADNATVASQGVVSSSPKIGSGKASSDSNDSQGIIPGAAQASQEVPPEPTNSGSARVDLIIRHLVERGFSQEAARRAAMPQRSSTIRVYNGIWARYSGWLDRRGLGDPLMCTVQLLTLYLEDMVKSGRAPSMVKTHKYLRDSKVSSSGGLGGKSGTAELPQEFVFGHTKGQKSSSQMESDSSAQGVKTTAV